MKILTAFATALLATAAVAQNTTGRPVNNLPTAPVCRVATFGPTCGAKLDGSLQRGGLQLDLGARAAPGSFVILMLGEPLNTRIALPGNICPLLVQPRHALVGQLDRTSAAQFFIPLRTAARFDVAFQGLVLDVSRGVISLDTSNGVHAACR